MKGRKIVLVGNPNVGKSLLFNALTGRYADVSNFPGTTVEVMRGHFGQDIIFDTPGIYGLGFFNEEERVACAVIEEAELIVNIVDAVHLERDLFLTLQLLDLGLPMLIGLNMMDEASAKGRIIQTKHLSELLGVPVYPLALAKRNQGLPALIAALDGDAASIGLGNRFLQERMEGISGELSPLQRLLIAEGDQQLAMQYRQRVENDRERCYAERRQYADKIADEVVIEQKRGSGFAEKLSRWMLSPFSGSVLLLLFLALFYYLIGVVVAQEVTFYTEDLFFNTLIVPWLQGIIWRFLPANSWLAIVLVGEYGLLSMALSYLCGLLLPLVVAFYLLMAVLEDSGYLPRLATLVDRQLRALGINGRGIIPLILGFGCVTMAGMATRILGSERERSIATFLLGLTIPCSAQLGILMAMTTKLGWQYSLLYLAVLAAVFVLTGFLLNRLLPGQAGPLLIDLPTLRLPKFGNVVHKAAAKTGAFMLDAVPLFCLGALLVSFLELSGGLQVLIDALAPLTVSWLHLPAETAGIFLLGMIRRDFGAAGLLTLPLTQAQSLIAMVVITLFVPCLASLLVFWKERGPRETIALWLSSLILAFSIGGMLAVFVA